MVSKFPRCGSGNRLTRPICSSVVAAITAMPRRETATAPAKRQVRVGTVLQVTAQGGRVVAHPLADLGEAPHEAAALKLSLHGGNGCGHSWVVCRQEIHGRQQQNRRIEILTVIVLAKVADQHPEFLGLSQLKDVRKGVLVVPNVRTGVMGR